ncbi:MAG: HlyD family efflux transporter periplasmic adaptor subunit [Ornithinibacter sp.]
MTWQNRIRLYGGILAVLAITSVLVIVFNQRQARALSVSGHVVAAEYSVGAAYGGVLIEALVEEGDMVTKGQPLFTVTSPKLQYDLSNGVEAISGDAFDVKERTGTVTYKALAPGRLSTVTAEVGGFLQNGANLATITTVGSESAVADFVLSPRDYERIEDGAAVDLRLPDNSTIPGTVDDVSVRTEAGQAVTTVTVASAAIQELDDTELSAAGTPVVATLHLRDDGPLAGPSDAFTGFLLKVGLR